MYAFTVNGKRLKSRKRIVTSWQIRMMGDVPWSDQLYFDVSSSDRPLMRSAPADPWMADSDKADLKGTPKVFYSLPVAHGS